jgi:predicted HAD superfamily Cof-like phosphohydrolase
MSDDICKCGKRRLMPLWESITDSSDQETNRTRHSRTECLTEHERYSIRRPRYAVGAEERALQAETQRDQLLVAIQTATAGDIIDGVGSKYRACLICRRDLNVCERDYRVAVETDALDRACKGAKVRALITSQEDILERSPVSYHVTEIHKPIEKGVLLDVPLSSAAKAELEKGLESARRGEIAPWESWEQSFVKLPIGACHDCGGDGQVMQPYGDGYNFDAVDCVTCAGTGSEYPSIRDMVFQFHAAFLPEQTRKGVGVPAEDIIRLRPKLVFEEAFELLRATFGARTDIEELWAYVQRLIRTAKIQVSLPEVADALADLAYVVEGGNLAYGIDSRAVLAEVHRSNLSKVGGYKNEDGKWVKPSTYSKPDIVSVLKKQGWQP